jgi:hypothetical protein
MASPPRTIAIGLYRIGDDRDKINGTGPRALPPDGPASSAVIQELNDLFSHWRTANETAKILVQ